MKLYLSLRNETKTCYRLEYKDATGSPASIYLKKAEVDAAGINPRKGVVITVEEAPNQ